MSEVALIQQAILSGCPPPNTAGPWTPYSGLSGESLQSPLAAGPTVPPVDGDELQNYHLLLLKSFIKSLLCRSRRYSDRC